MKQRPPMVAVECVNLVQGPGQPSPFYFLQAKRRKIQLIIINEVVQDSAREVADRAAKRTAAMSTYGASLLAAKATARTSIAGCR